MVAGLLGIYLSASFPLYVSLPLVIVLTVLLGFTIERVAYKPLRSAPRMSVMISAIGVSYLLQNTATYVTGGQPMTYPTVAFLARTVTIAGTPTKLVVILTPFLVALLVVVLSFIINHTKIGMAMRAVSKDFETSQLMGIKINSVISATFVIGSFLAAVGSILYFTNYLYRLAIRMLLPGSIVLILLSTMWLCKQMTICFICIKILTAITAPMVLCLWNAFARKTSATQTTSSTVII